MDEFSKDNYILDTLRHIDKIQKDIIVTSATSCITCETSLVTQANNTIPVSFVLCGGLPFKANLASEGAETTLFFRIECLRDNRYLTLRLLKPKDNSLTCSNQTTILDTNCICSLQCYQPINCEEC